MSGPSESLRIQYRQVFMTRGGRACTVKTVIIKNNQHGTNKWVQRKGRSSEENLQNPERSQVTRWSDDHGKYYSWRPHTNINDTSHLRASVCTLNCTYKVNKSSLLLYDSQEAKSGDASAPRCDWLQARQEVPPCWVFPPCHIKNEIKN